MNYQEAIKVASGIERAFRSLDKLKELLETAVEAQNAIVQAEKNLQSLKGEHEGDKAKSDDLKDKLKKMQATYADKMAEVEAKVQAKHDALDNKLEGERAIKAKLLQDIEADLNTAKVVHQSRMEEYQIREQKAKAEAERWETKLAEKKKAYEDFKAKL